jgi:hypothetical protein
MKKFVDAAKKGAKSKGALHAIGYPFALAGGAAEFVGKHVRKHPVAIPAGVAAGYVGYKIKKSIPPKQQPTGDEYILNSMGGDYNVP